ncbi:MAG: TlpA family protein disulfide reductase [Acidimicrobiales bacterium]|nr:TlpA family protein disulfide reductase [Acidimicrobiales bacterium]
MDAVLVDSDPAAEPIGRPRARLAPWIAAMVAVVLVAFIVVLATRKPASERAVSSQLIGKRVPAFTGTTLTGETYDIDARRGKFVVVNFFATWCVPCRLEHPELVKFSERHKQIGDAEVVSLAFDDSPDNIRTFFAEAGGDWPVIADGTGSTILDFGVSGVPESYVVAPNGQVIAKFLGVTDAALEGLLQRYDTPSAAETGAG